MKIDLSKLKENSNIYEDKGIKIYYYAFEDDGLITLANLRYVDNVKEEYSINCLINIKNSNEIENISYIKNCFESCCSVKKEEYVPTKEEKNLVDNFLKNIML